MKNMLLLLLFMMVGCVNAMDKSVKWWVNGQDSQGNTLLHHLVLNKDTTVEQVRWLVENGASLTIKNHNGKYVYHRCIRSQSDVRVAKGKCAKKGDDYLCSAQVFSYIHATTLDQLYQQKYLGV